MYLELVSKVNGFLKYFVYGQSENLRSEALNIAFHISMHVHTHRIHGTGILWYVYFPRFTIKNQVFMQVNIPYMVVMYTCKTIHLGMRLDTTVPAQLVTPVEVSLEFVEKINT